jgi:hypothetical protein
VEGGGEEEEWEECKKGGKQRSLNFKPIQVVLPGGGDLSRLLYTHLSL